MSRPYHHNSQRNINIIHIVTFSYGNQVSRDLQVSLKESRARSEVGGQRSASKMTLRALPFQFLNLGGEMMYIIDHRLRAQNIPTDRANKGEFCIRAWV